MRIGILENKNNMHAYIGSVNICGFNPVKIEKPSDLAEVQGLIISAEDKNCLAGLMSRKGIRECLKVLDTVDIPVFGIRMGLVLMAQEIQGLEFKEAELYTSGLLNITLKIKALKNILHKEYDKLSIPVLGKEPVLASNVNAPEIIRIEPNVGILCIYKGKIVMVRQGNYLGATFCPKGQDDRRLIEYFSKMVRDHCLSQQRFSC